MVIGLLFSEPAERQWTGAAGAATSGEPSGLINYSRVRRVQGWVRKSLLVESLVFPKLKINQLQHNIDFGSFSFRSHFAAIGYSESGKQRERVGESRTRALRCRRWHTLSGWVSVSNGIQLESAIEIRISNRTASKLAVRIRQHLNCSRAPVCNCAGWHELAL